MSPGKEETSIIPWIHGYEWVEVSSSIEKTIAAMGDEAEKLKITAHQIRTEYDNVNDDLDKACRITCVSCSEVCCMHATVWYDLRDLLYLYLVEGKLPRRQIDRHSDGSCCRLTSTGCNLERRRRPFICTWYICSSQRELLLQFPRIPETIRKIQNLRKQLEYLYVRNSL